MRTYEKSHPWITFTANFDRASTELWMLLGEAISKCEHIAGVPLAPKIAEDLHRIYLAKGVHATTAIEGNTLSEEDVRARIEGKRSLPESKKYLGREVDNILDACNKVILRDLAAAADGRITIDRIKLFNRLVLDGLDLSDDDAVPGEIRKHSVGVANYRGAPAEDCEFLLERMCDWINEPQGNLTPLQGASRAIILAILAHLYLAWIHPFGDGNGRTARLVEFQLLVSAGVPVPAAHLLSDHYNQTRSRYYRELDYASRSQGDIVRFVSYAAQGFVDGLRAQIERIRSHQVDVAWANFVHEVCAGGKHKSATEKRRRNLVLDLSEHNVPVPYASLMTVTGRTAVAYAKKTPRTLTRDLNELERLGLIAKDGVGYLAQKDRMRAFLPLRKGPLLQHGPTRLADAELEEEPRRHIDSDATEDQVSQERG